MYSYDVYWDTSKITWASRWDAYLRMPGGKVHWFSILNSLMVRLPGGWGVRVRRGQGKVHWLSLHPQLPHGAPAWGGAPPSPPPPKNNCQCTHAWGGCPGAEVHWLPTLDSLMVRLVGGVPQMPNAPVPVVVSSFLSCVPGCRWSW